MGVFSLYQMDALFYTAHLALYWRRGLATNISIARFPSKLLIFFYWLWAEKPTSKNTMIRKNKSVVNDEPRVAIIPRLT